jgi:hypothetical protein
MPPRKPKTIHVQSRIKPSTLATILTYLIKDGFAYKSISELVSASLELLCKILETNTGMIRLDDEERSNAALEMYFRGETIITANRVSILNKMEKENKTKT